LGWYAAPKLLNPFLRRLYAMTFEDAKRFWFGRVNYEQRAPLAGDLTLDRMRALLDRLGNPQANLRVVHVAGSKGKGSTAAMLASILQRAGYTTGLFTSPHLVTTAERIQVDRQPIPDGELAALMDDIKPQVEEMDRRRPAGAIGVTFFEIATALGFLHFLRRRTQVSVLEVGLGGRFDSTNVCSPMVSVITSISFDHTEQLGNTLAKIAGEKAGIIKPGVPVVSGVRGAEPRDVIEQVCRAQQAPLRQLDIDFRYRYQAGRVTQDTSYWPRVSVETRTKTWPEMDLALMGEHQAANAAVAVAAVEVLAQSGLHLPEAAVASGLATVAWPARLEVVRRAPLVVLDCAHNVASARALVETLDSSFPAAANSSNGDSCAGRRFLIFAGSGDKDLAGMFQELGGHFAHAFLTRYTQSKRGTPPEHLLDWWRRNATAAATIHATPQEAWQAALQAAGPNDLICITGSVFLAGEMRPLVCG
jgi:dihydrofolate synthase / folylpolyglutamate synthase